MKVVGLITEYNPFHNGHKYHIEEAKRIAHADYAIAIMSGNFVQRGTPAIMDKYSRTRMALQNGVDLVLELPVCYATGSAEYFAHGAVSLLDKLEIVNTICFGSESGDIELLKNAAKLLLRTPSFYEERLQALLRDGLTYPAARLKALEVLLDNEENINKTAVSKLLREPNNILGIEYLKALFRFSSSIEPVTIKRISAHYHEPKLSDKTKFISEDRSPVSSFSSAPDFDPDSYVISSATAIRNAIHNHRKELLKQAGESVPDDVSHYMIENFGKTFPITEEDFSQIIKYKILSEDSISLSKYMDISSDLADRMKNVFDFNLSLPELTQLFKTKNLTLTRINRALIHLLLNIKSDEVKKYNKNGYTQYARILGVRKNAFHLIRKIERQGNLPVLTKVAKADQQLDEVGLRMLTEDLFASHLYSEAIFHKFGKKLPNEYQHGICIL